MPLILLLTLARAEPLDELRAGRVDRALAETRAAVAAHPDDRDAWTLLVDLLHNLGEGGVAARRARELTRDHPDDAWAWAVRCRAEPEPGPALDACNRALALDDGLAPAWTGRGDVYRGIGRFDRAEADYRRALELDSGLGEAWSGLGATLLAGDRVGEALDVARRATLAAPDDPDGWLAVAALDPAGALTALEKGVRAVPGEPRLWAALGRARLESGDPRGAVEATRRALSIDPEQPALRVELAIALAVVEGRLDRRGQADLDRARQLADEAPVAAIDLLQQLAGRHPGAACVHLALGQVLAARRRGAEAEAALRRALELAPGQPEASLALATLLIGRGAGTEAEALLEPLLAAHPRWMELRLTHAIAVSRRDPAGAEALLDQLGREMPHRPEPALTLARLQAAAGRPDAAAAALERAAAREPLPALLLALAGARRDLGDEAGARRAIDRLVAVTGREDWRAAAGAGGGGAR